METADTTCALSGSISGAGKSIQIRLRMCGASSVPTLYAGCLSKRTFFFKRLAEKGLLAVDTWNSKREIVNFKATIEVPMLGSIIENSGDALDESHMPLGWPLSIDGAVRQFCSHKTATIQELDSMLQEFVFVLVLVCFFVCFVFRPFLQWIMHRTSVLTSCHCSHVKLPPRCQLPLH